MVKITNQKRQNYTQKSKSVIESIITESNLNDFLSQAQTLLSDHLQLIQATLSNDNQLMKDQNQLQDQLLKLNQIAPNPIDLSFTLGYLTFPFPLDYVKQVRPLAIQLLMMVQDGLVTSKNVLQVLAVLKFKIFGSDPKDLVKELRSNIQTLISQLALDRTYIKNKYFRKDFEKQEVVSQQLGIQCLICSTDINALQLCYLNCGHMYHKDCLNAHCKQKISTKVIPIPCPDEKCKSQLLQEEITLYLQHQLRDKYAQFAFHNYVEQHMGDTSWCPTPGCSAVFAFDKQLTKYKCPACSKDYCLCCKCEFHEGFTCAEYKKMANLSQEDKQFMFLVKGAKYKQCPNCKFWVQKNEGCDHMTCRCKYQFCYVCGGKYNRCKCKGFVNQIEQPYLHQLSALSVLLQQVDPPSEPEIDVHIEESTILQNNPPVTNLSRPNQINITIPREPQPTSKKIILVPYRERIALDRQKQSQRVKEAKLREKRQFEKQEQQEMTNALKYSLANKEEKAKQLQQKREFKKFNDLQELRLKMDTQLQKIKRLNEQYSNVNRVEKSQSEFFKKQEQKKQAPYNLLESQRDYQKPEYNGYEEEEILQKQRIKVPSFFSQLKQRSGQIKPPIYYKPGFSFSEYSPKKSRAKIDVLWKKGEQSPNHVQKESILAKHNQKI